MIVLDRNFSTCPIRLDLLISICIFVLSFCLSPVAFVFLTAKGIWTLHTFGSECAETGFHSVNHSVSKQRCVSAATVFSTSLCSQRRRPNALCCLPVKQLYIHGPFSFHPFFSLFCVSSFCLISFLISGILVVVMVGFGVSVMQPTGLFHGTNLVRQAEMSGGLRYIPIELVGGKDISMWEVYRLRMCFGLIRAWCKDASFSPSNNELHQCIFSQFLLSPDVLGLLWRRLLACAYMNRWAIPFLAANNR